MSHRCVMVAFSVILLQEERGSNDGRQSNDERKSQRGKSGSTMDVVGGQRLITFDGPDTVLTPPSDNFNDRWTQREREREDVFGKNSKGVKDWFVQCVLIIV